MYTIIDFYRLFYRFLMENGAYQKFVVDSFDYHQGINISRIWPTIRQKFQALDSLPSSIEDGAKKGLIFKIAVIRYICFCLYSGCKDGTHFDTRSAFGNCYLTFYWEVSNEGHEYWSKLNEKWKNYIEKKVGYDTLIVFYHDDLMKLVNIAIK